MGSALPQPTNSLVDPYLQFGKEQALIIPMDISKLFTNNQKAHKLQNNHADQLAALSIQNRLHLSSTILIKTDLM